MRPAWLACDTRSHCRSSSPTASTSSATSMRARAAAWLEAASRSAACPPCAAACDHRKGGRSRVGPSVAKGQRERERERELNSSLWRRPRERES
eukprot:6796712-Prymnesium_polylepis.1